MPDDTVEGAPQRAPPLAGGGAGEGGTAMRGMRDWLDLVLAAIATGVVGGAAVALLAELFGDPSTVLTLFVAGTVVSLRRR